MYYKQKCKVVSLNLAHPVVCLHVVPPREFTGKIKQC